MIGICTDSNAQMLGAVADRYAIEVVPVTVSVGGHEYLEGVDLDVDHFYDLLQEEPVVSTSPPSPGQFAAAYESLLNRGCDQILSIHVTATTSGTLSSARLAARSLPVPVRLVDSGTASFGVSCCVWAVARAVAGGATLDEAVRVVESLAPNIGSVFVRGASVSNDRVPVLTLRAGRSEVMTHVATMVDAVNTMARVATSWGPRLNIAVGLSDRATEPLVEALEDAVSSSANVVQVVRYRIGPSVGVYTGRGAVGCFIWPAE